MLIIIIICRFFFKSLFKDYIKDIQILFVFYHICYYNIVNITIYFLKYENYAYKNLHIQLFSLILGSVRLY